MRRKRTASPAPPPTNDWDERAVSAMSTLIEANDKGDLEAENGALASMASLIREYHERGKKDGVVGRS